MIPNVVKNILVAIEQHGFEAYLVGGFVRDFLLNKKTNDIDIATNARPKDIIEIFVPSKTEAEYGSVHLKVEDYNIDITTYRKEQAYENRRPVQVEYTSNLIEDAKRRDFTINALYMNKNCEIVDPFQYEQDIKKKVIRMIGNPNIRLKEDPLRILRAVRFACVYNFKLDKELASAIKKEKKNLTSLSLYRIKKELDAILLADGFSLLKKLDLLNVLGIQNKNIIYVEDLAGLWAQIKTSVSYPHEKNLEKRKKSIEKQLKCDTINMLWLYQNGYYDCRIVATIRHFSLKKLEKMMLNMPIHSRKDIVLSVDEIARISGKQGKELGLLLAEIEQSIVLKKVTNDRDSLQKFMKDR